MNEPARLSGLLVEIPARAREAPLTALACAACIFVFGGVWLGGDTETWEHVARWGAPTSDAIWDGAVWALLTSCFVHVEIVHIAFNLYWLWILGRAAEQELSGRVYLPLFAAAAIVSSAGQLALSGDTGIGMSGVVYGLFGFMWVARTKVPRFAALTDRRTIRWFLLWLVLCFVATRAGLWNVGNAAHLAGLLFGVGVALAWTRDAGRRAALAGTVVASTASLGFAFWCPWTANWTMWRGLRAHTRGDYAEAEAWYRRSLEQGQDPVWVWVNLGPLELAAGDEAGYREALVKLRTLDAEKAKWLVELARSRRSLLVSLKSSSDPVEKKVLAATLAGRDRNWRLAESSLRSIVAENPDDHRALNGMAEFLVFVKEDPSRAELRNALEFAQRAAELSGRQNVQVLDTLAEAWFGNGDPRKAHETAQEWQALLRKRGESVSADYQERATKYRAASGLSGR